MYHRPAKRSKERHPRLTLAIVEFELAWAPHLLSTMDCTYRERHGEAITGSRACPREGRGRHAAERLLSPQRRLKLSGGRHRHSPTPTLTLPRLRGRVRVGASKT
jgi:hypothetical protein